MAAWAQLGDERIRELVIYIRSLGRSAPSMRRVSGAGASGAMI